MKRSTIIGALALLTLVCLGVATLAIGRRQRAEARIAEMDRIRLASSARPSSARVDSSDAHIPRAADVPAPATRGEEAPPRPARPDVGALFAAHPELHAAYQQAVSGRMHQTYGRLFGRLGLSPTQIEQAVALLVQDAEHELDLAMTAQTLQLPKNDPALRPFRRGDKSDIEAKLEALLGAQGIQAWRDYNRARGMQSTVEDVASLTLATPTPMTGSQMEQLTRVLAEASGTYRAGGMPAWSSIDWPEVLRRASTFLAPAQIAALEAEIQQARAANLWSQFYASRAQR